MCQEIMDSYYKNMRVDRVRKNVRSGPTPRWKPLRVAAHQEDLRDDQALGLVRASAVRPAIRKHLHREQKRAELARLTNIMRLVNKKENVDAMFEESPAVACSNVHPAGAMAPKNTTQYLMGKVYEDMTTSNIQTVPVSPETNVNLYSEWLSPASVYSALDSGYESCLTFQERDFEEEFGRCW